MEQSVRNNRRSKSMSQLETEFFAENPRARSGEDQAIVTEKKNYLKKKDGSAHSIHVARNEQLGKKFTSACFLDKECEKMVVKEGDCSGKLKAVGKSSFFPEHVRNFLTAKGYLCLRDIYRGTFQLEKWNTMNEVESVIHPFLTEGTKITSDPVGAKGDEKIEKQRSAHLLSILVICWALVDLAHKQDDHFERGSFLIIDYHCRLYHHLLNYVKLVTAHENPKLLRYRDTLTNFAYRRDPASKASTHHKGRTRDSQFGIDIRLVAQESSRAILPFDLSHVLFGRIVHDDKQPENMLFMKMEKCGMGTKYEYLMHSTLLFKSKTLKSEEVVRAKRREKDILPVLKSLFSEMLLEEGMEQFECKTIRDMVDVASSFVEGGEKSKNQKARKLLEMLDELYPNGNHHLRCGNEVILDFTPSIYK